MNTAELLQQANELLSSYFSNYNGQTYHRMESILNKHIKNGNLIAQANVLLNKVSLDTTRDIIRLCNLIDADLPQSVVEKFYIRLQRNAEFYKLWDYDYDKNQLVIILTSLPKYSNKRFFHGLRFDNNNIARFVNCLLFDEFKSRIYENKDNGIFTKGEIDYVKHMRYGVSNCDNKLHIALPILSKCILHFHTLPSSPVL